MTVFAEMIAVYALSVVFVPAMRAPFVRERLLVLPLAVYAHLAGGAIALALGPFQLNARLRAAYLPVHRWTGRCYVGAVLAGGLGGLVLAGVSQGGLPAHAGFGMLAVVWLTTTGLAFRAIKAGDSATHRRWMIRSFSLTFAAVTLRIYIPLSQVIGIPFEPAYVTISWLCWVPNLLVAEWLIIGPRAAEPSEPAPRALAASAHRA
jgi:uncharacterized membrane protein